MQVDLQKSHDMSWYVLTGKKDLLDCWRLISSAASSLWEQSMIDAFSISGLPPPDILLRPSNVAALFKNHFINHNSLPVFLRPWWLHRSRISRRGYTCQSSWNSHQRESVSVKIGKSPYSNIWRATHARAGHHLAMLFLLHLDICVSPILV